ncbi:MAG: hypothetical protein ACLPTJ_13895 [Solirubrobacteraceae bacterium]
MAAAGTRSRAAAIVAALSALAITACGSSAPSLTVFKSGFETDRAQFRKLGQDLEATVGGAKDKTDAQLAAELQPLAARAREQGAQLAKLKPPASYKSNLDKLVTGFDAVAVDLRRIAAAAIKNDAQAAGAATRSLVADATKVKTADLAIADSLATNKVS